MKWKYKTIDIRSLAGLKQAERLKRNGWTIYQSSLTTIHFYKGER